MCLKTIEKSKFQLLGVSAMLIASKYEEIYAPEVRDFEYITDKTYSKLEIMEMELDILSKLNFDMLWVSPLTFFYRFYHVLDLKEAKTEKSENENKTLQKTILKKKEKVNETNKITNQTVFLLSNYFLELSLMEMKMVKYSSSLKAASALYISLKLSKTFFKEETFLKYTQFKEDDLKLCIIDMFRVYDYAPKIPIQACYLKYSDPKKGEIALKNFKN